MEADQTSLDVEVRVTDAAGQPVAGASVGAIVWTDPPREEGVAVTSGDGLANLRVPAGVLFDGIVALKDGQGMDYWQPPREKIRSRVGPDTLPPRVELVLDGARPILVKVVLRDGSPAAGAYVCPWTMGKPGKNQHYPQSCGEINVSGWRGARSIADGEGVARFDWIPRQLAGRVQFSASGSYHQLSRAVLQPGDGDGTVLSITAARLGEISGRVVFPDGRAAAGIAVQFESAGCSDYDRGVVRTNEEGFYRDVAFPEQTFMVAVADERWAARTICGLVVQEGQCTRVEDLVLAEGTLITGRATLGPQRQPMVGETITCVQRGDMAQCRDGNCGSAKLVRWASTDAEGVYSFRVGPGEYELMGPGHVETKKLTISTDKHVFHEFYLPHAPQGAISGQVVVAADGTAAGGAIVSGSMVRGMPMEAICDAGGVFSAQRNQERMLLWARSSDGALSGCAEIGATDSTARIALLPALSARGLIVDGQARPAAGTGALFWLKAALSDASEACFMIEARADDNGVLLVKGLFAGARLQLLAVGPDYKIIDGAAEVVVAPGRDGKITLLEIRIDG